MGVDPLVSEVLGRLGTSAAETFRHDIRQTIRPSGEPRTEAITDGLSWGPCIGEGAMGIVHRAEQRTLLRDVAVKSVQPAKRGRESTGELLREAWVTARMEHPNVVPVHDLGVDEGGEPYIVMKLLEGRPWDDFILRPDLIVRDFDEEDALSWNLKVFLEVCNAIAYAHEKGVIHRDIKPGNVMIGEFGEVTVVDWGIALALDERLADLIESASEESDICGTPAYMAPEMLRTKGAPPLTELTDVYLLGATLFEIITGKPPRSVEREGALLREILFGVPAIPAHVPEELAQIAKRALDRSPAGRHGSVTELARDVRLWLRHRQHIVAAREAMEVDDQISEAMEAGDRDRVSDLYAAARFGYRHALDGWPGYGKAQQRLNAMALRRAEFELANGDALAARSALNDHASPPAALLSSVEEAVARHSRELARLARFNQVFDPEVGRRLRLGLTLGGGFLFTVTPWSYQAIERLTFGGPHPFLAVFASLVFLVVALLVAALGYRPLLATRINRQILGAILLLPASQLSLSCGLWLRGVDGRTITIMLFAIWFGVGSTLAVSVHRMFWVPALAYLAAFLLSCSFPEFVFPLMSVTNAITTLVCAFIWGRRSWSVD